MRLTLCHFKIPNYFAETPFVFVHSHSKRSIKLKLTECSTPSKAIHPLPLKSFPPTITTTKKVNQLEFGTCYSLHSKGAHIFSRETVISTGRSFIEILLTQ